MTGPDRIFVQWPHQNSCGLAFTADGASGSRAEYVRRDPAVLAALPEVQALIRQAVDAEREACAPAISEVNDGRPCATDVFLIAAMEQLEDKWDFFEAVKDWCEGDLDGALVGVNLLASRAIRKRGEGKV